MYFFLRLESFTLAQCYSPCAPVCMTSKLSHTNKITLRYMLYRWYFYEREGEKGRKLSSDSDVAMVHWGTCLPRVSAFIPWFYKSYLPELPYYVSENTVCKLGNWSIEYKLSSLYCENYPSLESSYRVVNLHRSSCSNTVRSSWDIFLTRPRRSCCPSS